MTSMRRRDFNKDLGNTFISHIPHLSVDVEMSFIKKRDGYVIIDAWKCTDCTKKIFPFNLWDHDNNRIRKLMTP